MRGAWFVALVVGGRASTVDGALAAVVDVAWRGVSVRGARLSVARGASFALDHAVVAGTVDHAIEAEGASRELTDVWLHDHRAGPSCGAPAIVLSRGATARAQRFSVTRSDAGCVDVEGAGTGDSLSTSFSLEHGGFVDVAGECVRSFASRLRLAERAHRRAA